MVSGLTYRINDDELSYNSFDGELIVIHLPSGTYFSLHDTAAQIWAWMENHPVTASTLAASFCDAPDDVESRLEEFLHSLEAEHLAVTTDAPAPKIDSAPVAYSIPSLEPFQDLMELLKADIIHDTDDLGWPEVSVTE